MVKDNQHANRMLLTSLIAYGARYCGWCFHKDDI